MRNVWRRTYQWKEFGAAGKSLYFKGFGIPNPTQFK